MEHIANVTDRQSVLGAYPIEHRPAQYRLHYIASMLCKHRHRKL